MIDSNDQIDPLGLFAFCARLESRQESFVMVTLFSSLGHAPQHPGAKAIVTDQGLGYGTIGGGKLEAKAIVYASELLKQKEQSPKMIKWNLQKDIGMTCGGEVQLLFEVKVFDKWQIVIFGAGHVAQAVVRTLSNLNCRIDVYDKREEWLERLPKKANVRASAEDDLQFILSKYDGKTYFVVLTQGHATDFPVLVQIFNHFSNPKYVGVMGSEIKAKKIRKELVDAGIKPEVMAHLRCPIGLDLGSREPFEIAISIAAQLIETRGRRRSQDGER